MIVLLKGALFLSGRERFYLIKSVGMILTLCFLQYIIKVHWMQIEYCETILRIVYTHRLSKRNIVCQLNTMHIRVKILRRV